MGNLRFQSPSFPMQDGGGGRGYFGKNFPQEPKVPPDKKLTIFGVLSMNKADTNVVKIEVKLCYSF